MKYQNNSQPALNALKRREFIKLGLLTTGGAMLSSMGVPLAFADGGGGGGSFGSEPLPTSPRILEPFKDLLPIPQPLAPSNPSTWKAPDGTPCPPDLMDNSAVGAPCQIPDMLKSSWQGYNSISAYYLINLQTAPHSFTTSSVLRRNWVIKNGIPQLDGSTSMVPSLPASTMSLFNGTFPGSMIHAYYGQPCMVRFANCLDPNDPAYRDFGVPSFLTHLHNGHTAPESDGNPHFAPKGYDSWYMKGQGPAGPNWYCDNLYLNWPAGGDDAEKQSFFWFHDHRMDHTSANVYKGMVGLYPIYDPILDPNDETRGLRLPSGKYDVPLGLYDCRFDDAVTPHAGIENPLGQEKIASGAPPFLQDGQAHPENWGKLFFAKYPNHGFVGDIFTVNGTAYPVMPVDRRRYRLRFLDCSISRWYELKIMKGTVVDGTNTIGEQWMLTGAQQVMKWTQIAAEGGLLPSPIVRDSFKIQPAKRREFVVDFSQYMDGSPTKDGDVFYMVNTMQMTTGRQPDSPNSKYLVPLMKFVVNGSTAVVDNSLAPTAQTGRPLPVIPSSATMNTLPFKRFTLVSSSGAWQINYNGQPIGNNGGFFDPSIPGPTVVKDAPGEIWQIENGGGGWTHPLHLHMEEHRVLTRNGKPAPDSGHPDDISKEDVIALEPSEIVVVYRRFRDFTGPYVMHCHNLAHEDNAMMVGWSIV